MKKLFHEVVMGDRLYLTAFKKWGVVSWVDRSSFSTAYMGPYDTMEQNETDFSGVALEDGGSDVAWCEPEGIALGHNCMELGGKYRKVNGKIIRLMCISEEVRQEGPDAMIAFWYPDPDAPGMVNAIMESPEDTNMQNVMRSGLTDTFVEKLIARGLAYSLTKRGRDAAIEHAKALCGK